MPNRNPLRQVTAAGAVVLRDRADGQTEVLLVHRPGYQDWTLPKGKASASEYLPGCAARETLEETATRIRLGLPLDPIQYPIGGGTKTVSYWRARALRNGEHQPNAEVDQAAWYPVREALDLLTYADERPPLRQAIVLPDTVPLLLLRHAQALPRKSWSRPDELRPLDDPGRRQARKLNQLLGAYGVRRLVSSPAVRSVKSLRPYARANGLHIRHQPVLSEELAAVDPDAVTALVKKLARTTASSGTPLAICGHRPVLPILLSGLGITPIPLPPAGGLVLHLGPDAAVLAVERHDSPL